MKTLPASLLTFLCLAIACGAAQARSSDRNQPMDIDAGHSDYTPDDDRPTILSRGVVITQGTLDIRSSRAAITQRDGQAVRVVLSGQPVRMSQQLDNGDPMNAVADEVDYDLRQDIVVFTGDARVTQPGSSISGQRIVYDMESGRVQGGGEGAGRVRMRFQPRDGDGDGDGDGGDDGDSDAATGNGGTRGDDQAGG